MKKRDLVSSIVCLVIGAVCLVAGLFFDTKLESMLGAMAGILLVRGVLRLRDYLYWNAPENRERYQEILENERIENHDELKEKVRDRSGRYAYLFGLYFVCAAVVVIELLRIQEILDYNTTRAIMLSLGGYLVVQLIAERVIFKHLMKKY